MNDSFRLLDPVRQADAARQFTPGEFFWHGLAMSAILLAVLGLALVTLWPLLGMPVLIQ